MQIGTSLLLLFAGGSVVCRKICRGTCCEIMRPNPAGQGGGRRRVEILAPGAELASSLRFPAQRAVCLVFQSFVLHDFPLHIDFSTSLGLFSSAEKRTSPSPATHLLRVSQWMTKILLPGKFHKGKCWRLWRKGREGGVFHTRHHQKKKWAISLLHSSVRFVAHQGCWEVGGRRQEWRMGRLASPQSLVVLCMLKKHSSLYRSTGGTASTGASWNNWKRAAKMDLWWFEFRDSKV